MLVLEHSVLYWQSDPQSDQVLVGVAQWPTSRSRAVGQWTLGVLSSGGQVCYFLPNFGNFLLKKNISMTWPHILNKALTCALTGEGTRPLGFYG